MSPMSWIIPARAGFTPTTTRPTLTQRDHPRSRGVYSVFYFDTLLELGSSPLARGLRLVLAVGAGGDGIIPARAGFTLLSG